MDLELAVRWLEPRSGWVNGLALVVTEQLQREPVQVRQSTAGA